MAVLTLASRADSIDAVAISIAASYLAQQGHDVAITYKDAQYLSSPPIFAQLTDNNPETTIVTNNNILNHFQSLSGRSSQNTQNAKEADEWLAQCSPCTTEEGQNPIPFLVQLDSHLAGRKYLVGDALSLADIVLWVRIYLTNRALGNLGVFRDVHRWYMLVEDANPWITSAVAAG